MNRPRFDPHVHAAPSSRPRWGTDLDLVDAALRQGIRGFVLKSHHEATAARALIASQYADRLGIDCVVIGSVVLNPWVSLIELERALGLGARVVWWPTLDEAGHFGELDLPAIHTAALEMLEGRSDVIVATGHLAIKPALRLLADAQKHSLSVVATHPLNPDIGVGVAGGRTLAQHGAAVEIDARSLRLNRERGIEPARLVEELLNDAPSAFGCSDGGQLETGDPFAFLAAELAALAADGAIDNVAALLAGTDAWLKVLELE